MLSPSAFITTNPLEDFSIRYSNTLSGFITDEIFTPTVVKHRNGSFYQYGRDGMRVETVDAPSGSEAMRGDYNVFTKSFTTKEYAYKGLVLGRDARDFDRPVAALDEEQAQVNMEKLMLQREILAYSKISTTTNYPSALTSALTNSWASGAGDPIEDARLAKEAIFASTGRRGPIKLAISQKSLDYLKVHPGIVDRIKYTSAASVTAQMIATLLGVDKIVVSDVAKVTSLEGATDVVASVWGSTALFFIGDDSGRLKTLTFGRQFVANRLYTKTLDKPELGRDLGAHEIETGWEYALESAATVASGNDDFSAGYLYTGTHA